MTLDEVLTDIVAIAQKVFKTSHIELITTTTSKYYEGALDVIVRVKGKKVESFHIYPRGFDDQVYTKTLLKAVGKIFRSQANYWNKKA